MKIAVNTRFLLKNKLEGIGTFTNETMKRLTVKYPGHEFIFIFDRPYDESFIYADNIHPVVAYPPARHPVLWYLWFEWTLPYVFNKYKPDVFVSTDGYLSLRTKIPSIPVIHDLAFEHYPDDVSGMVAKYYQYYFPRFAQKAARIATVSTYSKNDISKRYDIPTDKIDVVYNGSADFFKPLLEADKREVKRKLTSGADYFVYVGALHARKNIDNLLKAFDSFKKKNDTGIKLVLIGRKAWATEKMEETFYNMEYNQDVVFTGSLSGEKLAKTLGAALALTYVSYFEGFGIPLIEAMSCDVPVITSDKSSLPEVAGDAALIIDPFSPESIADAMAVVAFDPRKRLFLIEKGRIQRQKFSWEKTANLLWDCILKAVNK